jgi:hypothetical protein
MTSELAALHSSIASPFSLPLVCVTVVETSDASVDKVALKAWADHRGKAQSEIASLSLAKMSLHAGREVLPEDRRSLAHEQQDKTRLPYCSY